jgi:hypothetical protein
VFTRPADLPDADVRAALVRGWGLDVVTVEHAPVGFGSHHWWVDTADGCRWFVTADDLRLGRRAGDERLDGPLGRLRAALTTATALRENGLDWVVAPLPATDGEVVVGLGEAYALSLYPRVEGRTFGWGAFEDAGHRTAVVDRLVTLHGTGVGRSGAGADDLGAGLVAGLRRLVESPGERWEAGPFGPEAWQLVTERGDLLGATLDRYASLVAEADPSRWVLTHGEPHRGNTIVTATGVVLVDWDTCLLAPPERDLWLLVGEERGIRERYATHTGTTLDDRLLDAYRLRWDLADVEAGVRDLRAPHTDDEDSRTGLAALRGVLNRSQPSG